MNDRELRRYQTFGRVSAFGKDSLADFPAASKAAAYFTNLAQILTQLDTAKAGQTFGSVTAKEVLLDALRLDLSNIARTARAIAQDEPGFADKFRMPDSANETPLLTAAAAFIIELNQAGVAAKFIEHDLPADFVEHIQDDLDAIDDTKEAKETSREGGIASTAAIGRLIRDGMKQVNYLDAIMHNKYARNADKLRVWQSASHIERAPQREEKPVVPVPLTN